MVGALTREKRTLLTSRRAAALTTASAVVLALAPLVSAQAVTATTSLFIIRAAETPVTDLGPTSIPIVNGVNGGTVGTGTEYYGRLVLNAQRNSPEFGWQSAFLFVPRKAATGTYPVPAGGGGTSAFQYSDGCSNGDGTAVVRDAAWNADGSPIRLSITLSLPCGTSGNSGRAGSTSVEIRYNEPTASALVGEVELTGPHPTVSTVVGTPVDATRTFTNHGTGPAFMGAAAIAWSQISSYPAFSIKQDGCKGTTLQPQQSCDVVVRFAPQVSSHDRAVLVVPDGRPQPAGADVYGDATPEHPTSPCSSRPPASSAVRS